MNTTQWLIIAGVAYLLFKNGGLSSLFGGSTGATGTTTGSPNPTQPSGPTAASLAACSAAGGVWDTVTNMCVPANVITGHSDPTTLAMRLIQVAHNNGYTDSNPVFNYDQWSYFAERLDPPLTPPDFGSVAPRDANGQTPQVTALQYAQNFVQLMANPGGGVSGLNGLRGLRAAPTSINYPLGGDSKWRM